MDTDGPACHNCQTSEARCAHRYGLCCARCTHWTNFTAGGELINNGAGRCPRPREHGTARGYWQHKNNDEEPCSACKHGRVA